MRVFDLHCDTLYEMDKKSCGLYDNGLCVSLKKVESYCPYIGCFAIWISDEHTAKSGFSLFQKIFSRFLQELSVNQKQVIFCKAPDNFKILACGPLRGKQGIILTLENGSILDNKIERLDYLYDCGVRMMTLTWNGRNCIGDGNGVENPKGITNFGIKVLNKMENLGIVVDVSHASEELFYDVAQNAKRPFMASHSNSFAVCPNKRNITDEQFNIIKSVGGIVGINFYKKFLKENGESSIYDIMRHIDHFLELSGQKNLAIGSDFDGCEVTDELKDIGCMPVLYEYLLRHNYSEELVRDIFFNNAYRFFENYFEESKQKGL